MSENPSKKMRKKKKKQKPVKLTKPNFQQKISQSVIVNLGGKKYQRKKTTQAKRSSVPQTVVYQNNPIPLQPNYSAQINDLRNEVIATQRSRQVNPSHNTGNLLGQREVALQEGLQETGVQTERQMVSDGGMQTDFSTPARFSEEVDSGSQTERQMVSDGGSQTEPTQDPQTEREVGRVMEDMLGKVEMRREQDFIPTPVVALQKPVLEEKPVVVQEKKHSQRHADLLRRHQEAVERHQEAMSNEIEFRDRARRESQERLSQSQIRASSDYMIALADQALDDADETDRKIRDSTDVMNKLAREKLIKDQKQTIKDQREREKSFVDDVEKKLVEEAKRKQEIKDQMEVARSVESLIGGVEARQIKDKVKARDLKEKVKSNEDKPITFGDVFKSMATLDKTLDSERQSRQRLDAERQRLDVARQREIDAVREQQRTANIATGKIKKERKKRSDAGVPRGELLRTADKRASERGFAVVSVPKETPSLQPQRQAQFEVQGNFATFKPTGGFETIKKPMGSTLTTTIEEREEFLEKAQKAFSGTGRSLLSPKKTIKINRSQSRLKAKIGQQKLEEAFRRSRDSKESVLEEEEQDFVGIGEASEPTFI
jgi:hypothetical protein